MDMSRYAMAGVVAVVLISILLFRGGYFSFTAGPETRVVYPEFSSVCCMANQVEFWVEANAPSIANYDATYTCPLGTTQCRFDTPSITCPGISWEHPLGMTPLWHLTLTEQGGTTQTYCSLPLICQSVPNGLKEFKPTEVLKYNGGCVDNTVIAGIINPLFLYNAILGNGIAPTTGSFRIDYVNTMLWRFPASGGQYGIPNTALCVRNDEAMAYAMQAPMGGQQGVVEGVKNVVRYFGYKIDAPQATLGDLVEKTQMLPGECYLAVERWVDLPLYGNVNPLGSYQGKDVLCSYQGGLMELKALQSYDYVNYVVPVSRLTSPDRFCCDHQLCKSTYGVDFNCVNYSCQQQAGFCRSDLDCQPMGGEMMSANCYRQNNKFYTWESKCVNSVCTSPNTREVKCCPSYCNQFGMWCDQNVGCVPNVVKQNCPVGGCCNIQPLNTNEAQSPYYTQQCSAGLKCCPSNDKYQGYCSQTCENTNDAVCGGECVSQGYESGHCALEPSVNPSAIVIGGDLLSFCPKNETSIGFNSHGCSLSCCSCVGGKASGIPWLWCLIGAFMLFGLTYFYMEKEGEETRRQKALFMGAIGLLLPWILVLAGVKLPPIEAQAISAVKGLFPTPWVPPFLASIILGGVVGAVLGVISFKIAPQVGVVVGFIVGAVLTWIIRDVLMTIQPYVAAVGGLLGIYYAWKALGSSVEDERVRYLLAGILGILTGVVLYVSFWVGLLLLGAYALLRMATSLDVMNAFKNG